METLKTLNRSEIEQLGKVVNVSKPQAEKTLTEVAEETLKESIEIDNAKPKTKISMSKNLKLQESRIMNYLGNRKKITSKNIANVTKGEYIQGANLLLRMEERGVLKKIKRGVYTLATTQPIAKQTEMKFRKSPEKPYAITQEQRMANMREAKRQKKIERELSGESKVTEFNADEKLVNLIRLRKEVGRAPSFYKRVEKEIEKLLLGVRYKEPSLKTLNNGKLISTNQKLSGFRLIKSYPNCPYAIGVVIPGSKDLFNYPEYWQPQYQATKPELTEEQKSLIQEAKEYMQVAMDLIKKAETNG
jgi:hypothetical protein